jgi:hypothetical protein
MKTNKLIAVFVFKERIDSFISFLLDNFNITKNKVFCFNILNDENKYLVTFKLDLTKTNINLKTKFPQFLTIHKKVSTFYTINALNKLIEELIGASDVDKKTIMINWSEYKNKVIFLKDNELSILDIERIF